MQWLYRYRLVALPSVRLADIETHFNLLFLARWQPNIGNICSWSSWSGADWSRGSLRTCKMSKMPPFLICVCSRMARFSSASTPSPIVLDAVKYWVASPQCTLWWYLEQVTGENGSLGDHRFVWLDVGLDFARWLLRLNVGVWAVTFRGVLPHIGIGWYPQKYAPKVFGP